MSAPRVHAHGALQMHKIRIDTIKGEPLFRYRPSRPSRPVAVVVRLVSAPRPTGSMLRTVRHASGAESLDFEHELDQIVPSEPDCERSSRSSSAASTVSLRPPSPDIKTILQRKNTVYGGLTDLIILKCVEMFGQRWRAIARHLGAGWSDDMVRNRFLRIEQHMLLHAVHTPDAPSAPKVAQRKDATPTKPTKPTDKWTEDEDRQLITHLEKCRGTSSVPWGDIHITLGTRRSKNAIRNRAFRLGFVGEAVR